MTSYRRHHHHYHQQQQSSSNVSKTNIWVGLHGQGLALVFEGKAKTNKNCDIDLPIPVAYLISFLLYHRRAVAQPCVNGDRLSKGRMAKFDPAQIRIDRQKFETSDYVRETTPGAKFRANPSIGGNHIWRV